MPGTSVRSPPPWRFAIRWTTLSVYVSSSFVPKMTSSTTPTAAATSAASKRPAEVVDADRLRPDLRRQKEHQRVEHEDGHETRAAP